MGLSIHNGSSTNIVTLCLVLRVAFVSCHLTKPRTAAAPPPPPSAGPNQLRCNISTKSTGIVHTPLFRHRFPPTSDGIDPVHFADPVRSIEQLEAMTPLDDPAASLPFIKDILGSLRQEIDGSTTLLGFVGSPWTLTAYAMEGAAERHCKATKVCTHVL